MAAVFTIRCGGCDRSVELPAAPTQDEGGVLAIGIDRIDHVVDDVAKLDGWFSLGAGAITTDMLRGQPVEHVCNVCVELLPPRLRESIRALAARIALQREQLEATRGALLAGMPPQGVLRRRPKPYSPA